MSQQDNPAPVLSADTKKSLEQIIVDVAKKHNVKAMELTTKHLSIISDCMEEYAAQKQPIPVLSADEWLKKEGYPETMIMTFDNLVIILNLFTQHKNNLFQMKEALNT